MVESLLRGGKNTEKTSTFRWKKPLSPAGDEEALWLHLKALQQT